MTKLYDGQITDLLRNNPLQHDPKVEALAYAVREEKRRIMDSAAKTRTMAMPDDLPESILDTLAVELRTPAYDETFPIETKRKLIKGTLAFYARLGTPWAVNWVIRTIFGNGQISSFIRSTAGAACSPFPEVTMSPATKMSSGFSLRIAWRRRSLPSPKTVL